MQMIQQTLQRTMNFKTFRKCVFALIVFLTVFQQFPLVYESFYSEFRLVMYLLFGIFAITSVFSVRTLLSHISIKLFVIAIISTIIINLIRFYLEASISFELIVEFLVPFGIIVCALSLDFNKKELNMFIFVYVILTLIMGLRTIFYYGDGFVLPRDVYIIDNKNQLGPLLGISALIMLLSIFDKKIFDIKFLGVASKIIIFTLLMGCILVMRNRAGSLAIIITMLFYLIISKNVLFKKENLIILILIISSSIVLYYLGPLRSIVDFVWESFTRNYDISDLDNFSAGRLEVLIDATVYIRENPLLGRLGGIPFNGSIHNYLLRKWADYGLILSLPIVILYMYLYFFIFQNVTKKNNGIALLVGWLMFFSLIISNLEYSYPFGPGVSQLMLWFLFGINIKSADKKTYCIKKYVL
jgi:hypothetical protein